MRRQCKVRYLRPGDGFSAGETVMVDEAFAIGRAQLRIVEIVGGIPVEASSAVDTRELDQAERARAAAKLREDVEAEAMDVRSRPRRRVIK